ncbi:MAG: nucleotidyltransferase domain-containing protein [Caldilineales bacterium]|nr:nucleotidyltransferase domain-containing protein [Caldilineales bacterium]
MDSKSVAMSTALTLSLEERQRYLRAARQRQLPAPITPAQEIDRSLLLERVREAVRELKHRFDVQRVVLFGSLAHGAWYDDTTDVDMAVEGMKGGDFWRAWRLVEEVIADRAVDFVALETASEPLRAAIQADGIEL